MCSSSCLKHCKMIRCNAVGVVWSIQGLETRWAIYVFGIQPSDKSITSGVRCLIILSSVIVCADLCWLPFYQYSLLTIELHLCSTDELKTDSHWCEKARSLTAYFFISTFCNSPLVINKSTFFSNSSWLLTFTPSVHDTPPQVVCDHLKQAYV